MEQLKTNNKSGASNYEMDQVIGSGTFGSVYLATDKTTRQKVAIKKVFQDRRYKNREYQLISELKHPNIVSLYSAYYTNGDKPGDVYLNLVMEYVPQTLSKEIRENRKSRRQMNPIQLKMYAYQMIRAMVYQQSLGLAHRDIKPQNILIDPKQNTLKVCDYGSAKKLIKGQENIAYICSRYYRSPELIFGATQYTTQIDMWSIGCVLVEMITGEPIFPGTSAVDQLIQIIKILGTPDKNQIKQLNPKHVDNQFPEIKTVPWSKILGKFKPDPQFVDLISKILVYEPQKRYQPLQALAHPYFNELRDINFYKMNKDINIPNFFNWNNQEKYIGLKYLAQLTPQWYKQQIQQQREQQKQTQQSQQQQQQEDSGQSTNSNSTNNNNNGNNNNYKQYN